MRLKGGIFLEKELSSSYFMILVGILALIFFIYQLTIFMINKNKIDYTDGTIVGANTAVPETMKKNNSKWAIVSYKVRIPAYPDSESEGIRTLIPAVSGQVFR
jgi:hypothetical protein